MNKEHIKYWKDHFGEINLISFKLTNQEIDYIMDALEEYKFEKSVHPKEIMQTTKKHIINGLCKTIIQYYKIKNKGR